MPFGTLQIMGCLTHCTLFQVPFYIVFEDSLTFGSHYLFCAKRLCSSLLPRKKANALLRIFNKTSLRIYPTFLVIVLASYVLHLGIGFRQDVDVHG